MDHHKFVNLRKMVLSLNQICNKNRNLYQIPKRIYSSTIKEDIDWRTIKYVINEFDSFFVILCVLSFQFANNIIYKNKIFQIIQIASSPSSQSLSNSDLMITPNPSSNILTGSRQSKSTIKLKQDRSNSDGEDIGKSKKKPLNLPPKAPSMGSKARVSRNISASSISVSGISHEELITQPDMAQIKSRKSAKHCYIPLDDEEIEKENANDNNIIINNTKETDDNKNDGNYTPTPLSYKASKANAMFTNDDNPNNS